MSKIAEIRWCIECPHCKVSFENFRCDKKNKLIDELLIDNRDIPKWCPLEDKKDD